jgi:hypothetical protein
MPGFGSGPFGNGSFGEAAWAKSVLFDLAPEDSRNADVDRLFELYASAQGEAFDGLRHKIRDFGELRDPYAVRADYQESTTLLLGAVQRVQGPVEQSGIQALVTALGALRVDRGRFTFDDIGKEITVRGSSVLGNNRSVQVTSIVTPTEVLTHPPLAVDPGPLRWELRTQQAAQVDQTLVEVVAGDVTEIVPGWILSDGYTDFEVLARAQFYTPAEDRKLLTEREGQDGYITGGLVFTAPSAAFLQRDVGKRITISGTQTRPPTSAQSNTGKFQIVEVLSATEVVLDSPDVYSDGGPLQWAVLRRPILTLGGAATLRGVVEQVGEDLTILGGATLEASSGEFSSADVGKLLTILAAADPNNGVIFEVTGVLSSRQVTVTPTPTPSAATFRYELRTETLLGDSREVTVRAPGLLPFLARDFGISVDAREEEAYQRRWVDSVSRWIGLKGGAQAYPYLAALTGYDQTDVIPLYRVNQENYEGVLAAGGVGHAVGEAYAGSYGLDGSLNVVSGRARFSSPTANFNETAYSLQILISGSSGGLNDGLRTVSSIVSTTTVEFRVTDTMVGLSDVANGALEWTLVRLYSEEAPLLPVYDEINSDLMTYLKGPTVFTVDKYSWEQSPAPWNTLIGSGDGFTTLVSSDPSIPSAFPQTYTLRGQGDFDVAVGLGVGKWKLTDLSGVEHFLETVPQFPQSAYATTETSSLVTFVAGAPHTITAPAGTFSSVLAGDLAITRLFVLSPYVTPPPPSLTNGWLVASVNGTGSILTLDASYAPAAGTYAVEVTVLRPERSGLDGSLTGAGPAEFTSPTAGFSAADQGMRVLVYQSGSSNNGTYASGLPTSATDTDLEGYETPATPDSNNGSLTWALVQYEFSVLATAPPDLDVCTLEYVCSEQTNCGFCKANRILIRSSTPYLLEAGEERLRTRLQEVTPRHVSLVESYGARPTASLSLSASGSSTFP